LLFLHYNTAFLKMSPTVSNLVEIRDLHFAYGDRSILSNLSMDFPRGKVVAVMGGSGCGKTTVLRLIGGQIRPQRGAVTVAGEVVHKLDTDGLYRLRRKMGMLFQFGALFTDLTVFENVAFPLREHTDLPEEVIRDMVLLKLNAVGLRNAAQLKPAEISGGMARRVAVARAVALDPELIMLRRAVRRPRPDLDGRDGQPDPPPQRRPRFHLGAGVARCARVLRHRGLRLLYVGRQDRGPGHARRHAQVGRSIRETIRQCRARWPGAVPLPRPLAGG
jgi:ABC-type lipoprotein export system ATPase subunit